jgi:hypothetical protein
MDQSGYVRPGEPCAVRVSRLSTVAKSEANSPKVSGHYDENFPVLGRLTRENGFDRHCVPQADAVFTKRKLRSPRSPACLGRYQNRIIRPSRHNASRHQEMATRKMAHPRLQLSQKRKRSPTVGSIVLRLRKPFAKPPLTCENMMPA